MPMASKAARRRRLRRERRGRPPQATAQRRQTTAAARRPERDRGTPELRRQRRERTGREDLPHDLPGSLFGRGLIDLKQYRALLELAHLVRLVRLGFGLGEGSVAGQWRNILTAAHGGWSVVVPAGADRARFVLVRLRSELPEGIWTVLADTVDDLWPDLSDDFDRFLVRLCFGLDHLARRLPVLVFAKQPRNSSNIA
jgi:hypothetical protein